MKAPLLNRKIHRIIAIWAALPLLIVILTGILLQLKKQSDWIQPPTARGARPELAASIDDILASARTVEPAGISSWEDIDRLDVRPSKGIVKVRAENRWEIQIDTSTGEVVQVAYRRSDLIENLHDGSFFTEVVKLGLFLPAAVALLALWATGMWLWWLPHRTRRRRNRRRR